MSKKSERPVLEPVHRADGDADNELPSYTRDHPSPQSPQSPTSASGSKTGSEHVYSLEGGSGNKTTPWVYLKVNSKSKSPKSLPLFTEGETVTGSVDLNLEKTEHIQGILLSLRAETLQVGQEPEPFYTDTRPLWNVEMGEARSSPSDTGSSKSKAGSPKLKGSYSWPFSIPLPREVHASSTPKEPKKPYRCPPSFTERASPAYVEYKLTVTIQRGRFRVDHTLSTSLAYVVRTKAEAPSELRQAAYREGGQLAGPDIDINGWAVLKPVTIQGTLFDDRQVSVECTLAIGSPLVFALNSPVSLWMTLKSSDTQALDLLASSKAIMVRLRRTLAIGDDAVDEDREQRSDNTFPQVSGQGLFWPLQTLSGDSETPNTSTERVLEGEVYIPPTAKTSFVFPRVVIRYYLDLLPFAVAGFAVEGSPSDVLVSQQIDIRFDQAPGVPLRSRAPPGYTAEQGAQYNNTIGMLTQANQRFIHYHHYSGTA